MCHFKKHQITRLLTPPQPIMLMYYYMSKSVHGFRFKYSNAMAFREPHPKIIHFFVLHDSLATINHTHRGGQASYIIRSLPSSSKNYGIHPFWYLHRLHTFIYTHRQNIVKYRFPDLTSSIRISAIVHLPRFAMTSILQT